MKRLLGSLVVTAPALALLASTGTATAQLDPLPNVLLLVDTSGSMEYRTGFYVDPSNANVEVEPYCNPNLNTPQGPRTCATEEVISGQTCAMYERSRWIDLVEVLTGELRDFRCEAIDRENAVPGDRFTNLYRLNGLLPYDVGYGSPFHRLLVRTTDASGLVTTGFCAPGPAVPNPTVGPLTLASGLPLDQIAWNAQLFDGTNVNDPDCLDLDANDRAESPAVEKYFGGGLLDTYADQIRFGLMTFDTRPEPGTGEFDYQDGISGTWGFKGTADGEHWGSPIDCGSPTRMEVGARNQFAPAWEGRLIGFGDPEDIVPNRRRNQSIQRTLLATRPYGGTPIAGMLHDAYQFFFTDDQPDPMGTGYRLGPQLATLDTSGLEQCRQNVIILLTDGEPNQELRPACEPDAIPVTAENDPSYAPPNSTCPYHTPQWIARQLSGKGSATSAPKVPVFVVGFSLSRVTVDGTEKSCAELDLAAGECSQATIDAQPEQYQRPLKTCCLLNEIAYWGDTERAYFADDREQLQYALDVVLSRVSSRATARTRPVFANASGYAAGQTSFRFFSGFLSQAAELRKGVLQRRRYVCENPEDEDPNPVPVLKDFDPELGDDFVYNVNRARGADRNLFTYQGGPAANFIDSRATLRPLLAASDGVGAPSVGELKVGSSNSLDNFASTLEPAAFGIGTAGSCPARIEDASDTDANPLAPTTCRNIALNWLFGKTQPGYRSRCDADSCNLVADIYRATPILVGRPSSLIADETYRRFANDATSYSATATGPDDHRPLVLYTSTNDGMLHAFRVASSGTTEDEGETFTPEMNELWAFMPPAVLPELPALYPGRKVILLDGEPVARDVVASPSTQFPSYPWKLERGTILSRVGQNGTDPAAWRTILVQSFGGHSAAGSGYYAIDITDPEYDAAGARGGPKFLWQLTVDSANNPLFGNTTAAPLITTVFISPSPAADPREVAVAVLPGGASNDDGGDGGTGAGCDTPTNTRVGQAAGYERRPKVRCYPVSANAGQPSRSVTIVRLDSGEILTTFRNKAADVDPLPPSVTPRLVVSAARVKDTPLTSPITGQPAAFPAGVGAVSDRIYIGDADGVLWRIDLSSTDPSRWVMEPFFDTYNAAVDPPTDASGAVMTLTGGMAEAGPPIFTAPVVSTDQSGAVILNLSTGSQDFVDAPYFPATVTAYAGAGETLPAMGTVWSVREVEDVGSGTIRVDPRWFLRLPGGERVTGPLQLFNGQVFFTSMWPVSGMGVCTEGETRVWGLDYAVPHDAADPSAGGLARFPVDCAAPQAGACYDRCVSGADPATFPKGTDVTSCTESALPEGTAIFGVTVAQVQTCSEGDGSSIDPFVGGTSHTSVSRMTAGKFQLVMQAGNQGATAEGGTLQALPAVDLAVPAAVPVIESWAAIIE